MQGVEGGWVGVGEGVGALHMGACASVCGGRRLLPCRLREQPA